ncbi:MAG: alpha/beta hydrolase [Chloroflexi bacterium]|nr:alpha/beta hydrolase [Chloroflexota bacterium]
MPLHPDAAAFMKQREAWGVIPTNELTPEAAREQSMRVTKLLGPGEPVAHVENRTIKTHDAEVDIRIYRPAGDGPFPVVVYYHGGGWVLGNLDVVDFYCRALTNASGYIVVSSNYRHGPEDRFPAAPEDCYAALVWVARNAASFGGDASRIAVAGASAGGNLAAVVCQMARDRNGPALKFQLLIVPVTNHFFSTASYRDNAEGYMLTTAAMKWFWERYLKDPADGAHPYASPLRAQSLAGLPPAFVQTAELDPLRDEGEQYAERLKQAGVPVVQKRYIGMIHGFLGPDALPDSVAQLRQALG